MGVWGRSPTRWGYREGLSAGAGWADSEVRVLGGPDEVFLGWRRITGLIPVSGAPASGGPEALVPLHNPRVSSLCEWCPLRLCSTQPAQLSVASLCLRIPIQGFSPLHKESLRGCLLTYGAMAWLQGLREFFERGHNCVYRLVFLG